jgi:lipoprotein NlpI
MLWYGIGILYDRYGSYDYAEEAFSQVMNIQPDFEKANEIYFRLGIIYKQQNKWSQSLDVSFLSLWSPLMRVAHNYSVSNTLSILLPAL